MDNKSKKLEASFLQFLYGMAAQTQIQLGLVPHPLTGELNLDATQAKYSLDLLNILAEKTKGNLTDEEEVYLKDILQKLQISYNDIAG